MDSEIFALSNQVKASFGDGNAILLDAKTGQYYMLNAVGSRICSLVAGGLSENRIADMLTSQYGVSGSQAERDVSAFLGQLLNKGLLTKK